jgi:hypothetical protein
MRIPTITVDRDGKPVVINRSAFRDGVDRVWKEPGAQEAAPSVTAPEREPEVDERAELFAKLAERGITPDGRAGLKKLRELLANA